MASQANMRPQLHRQRTVGTAALLAGSSFDLKQRGRDGLKGFSRPVSFSSPTKDGDLTSEFGTDKLPSPKVVDALAQRVTWARSATSQRADLGINYAAMTAANSMNSLGCRICGERKTVKSHIFPRALMADLRGEDSYLHEITQDRKGTKFLQSGPIDDSILCVLHENATQAADRYGIEFCRRVIAEVRLVGGRTQVSNPNPDLLVRFACLNIWRHCISKNGPGIGALGSYGTQLEAAVFYNASELPLLLLARNNLRINRDAEATIAIAPFPVRLAEIRFWLFSFSGVQFYLKLDKRGSPAGSECLAANGANPATIRQLDPKLAHNVPILQSLMANMVARRN